MTTITILVWVGDSVYKAFISKPEPSVPPEILAPIKTDINTKILEEIKERVYFERGEVSEFILVAESSDLAIDESEPEEESLVITEETLETLTPTPGTEESTGAGELEV